MHTHPPQAWNFNHPRNHLHHVVKTQNLQYLPLMRLTDGSLIKKVMNKFGQSLGNPPQIHKFHGAFDQ